MTTDINSLQVKNDSSLFWTEGVAGAVGGVFGGWATGGSTKEMMYGSGAYFLANLATHAYYANEKNFQAKKGSCYVLKFYKVGGKASKTTYSADGTGLTVDADNTGIPYQVWVGGGSPASGTAGLSSPGANKITSDVAISALAFVAGSMFAGANLKETLGGVAGAVIGTQLVTSYSSSS